MTTHDFLSGVRFQTTLYLCSDSAGIYGRFVQIGEAPFCPPSGLSLAELLGLFASPEIVASVLEDADDWRAMTPAEIEEYEAARMELEAADA